MPAQNTRTIRRATLEDALGMAEIDWDYESTIRDTYSGRGMYGAECVAIVLDSEREAFGLFAALGVLLGEDVAVPLARATRTDSMGRDIIIYWPRWTLSDE